MQKMPNDIIVFLTIVTILILAMIIFIISVIFLHQKNQKKYLKEVENLKHNYENNLLKSRVEVQEQTIQNISREIHDNICLSLTLAKLQLNTLNIGERDKSIEVINSSVDLLTKSIKDLSDLSKSMNADIIVHDGLIDALENETAKISKAGHLEIITEINGDPVFLDAQKELVVFRIIQEAFNNIIKHASARKVTLDLFYDTNHIEIAIKDDGKGFNPEHLPIKNGAGLNNMKIRAKAFSGDVFIESKPGSGTKVLISFPF